MKRVETDARCQRFKEMVVMPDVDVLPSGLGRKWRRVLNLIRDERDLDEIAQATATAVAHGMKSTGGVARLPDIAEACCLAARQVESELDFSLPLPAIDEIVPRNVPAMIAAEAATVLVSTRTAELADASTSLARQLVAVETIRRFARHEGLDRIAVRLLRDLDRDPDDLAMRIDLVLEHPVIVRLAESFARQPTSERLRAPSRRRIQITADTDLEAGDL
jgi:hypothetical protein